MGVTLTATNATPTSLGDELLRLRTTAGLTLDHIAGETKVSTRILEALESGRYKHLPEKVFSRNFLRQYAECIGADPRPLLAAFDQAWERHLLASGMHPALVEEVRESVTPSIHWRFWLPTSLGAAILVLVGIFILRSSPGSPDLQPDPRRSVAGRPSPTFAVPLRTQPPPSPVRAVPDTTSAENQSGELTIRIQVRSGRECWFHARDRAGLQEQQLLSGGQAADLTLAQPVKLTLGNAGAVTLQVNGKEYLDLGGLGEVVHLDVTESGISSLGDGVKIDG